MLTSTAAVNKKACKNFILFSLIVKIRRSFLVEKINDLGGTCDELRIVCCLAGETGSYYMADELLGTKNVT